MKKILLGTTMLIGFATAAAAETPKVTIGGVADFQAGYASQDGDNNQRHHAMRSDTEVTFRIDAKTDAGLEYGGGINLEADVSPDADGQGFNASQTYVYLGGLWGRFELGSNLGADQTLKVDASTIARATGGIDGDWYYYFNNPTGARFLATPDLPMNYGYASGGYGSEQQENVNKVTYYTPRFAGFQLGLSYSADDRNSGQGIGFLPLNGSAAANLDRSNNNPGRAQNVFAGGVNYDNKFGDFGVTLAATGEWANSELHTYDNIRAYSAGGKVSWFGFSVAGSYGIWDEAAQLKALNANASHYWTLGGAYEFGPFGTSVTYLSSKYDNGLTVLPGGTFNTQDNFRNLSVGVDYKLAPGLTPYAEVSFVNADTATDAGDNKGYVIIAGTQLNF